MKPERIEEIKACVAAYGDALVMSPCLNRAELLHLLRCAEEMAKAETQDATIRSLRYTRADLDRRTVDLLQEILDGDGPSGLKAKARTLLAEWREVRRG